MWSTGRCRSLVRRAGQTSRFLSNLTGACRLITEPVSTCRIAWIKAAIRPVQHDTCFGADIQNLQNVPGIVRQQLG